MQKSLSQLNSFVRGTFFVLLAIFLFDVMGAIIKYMGASYPAQQLSMFRNLFGMVPALVILFLSPSWHSAGRPVIIRQWKLGLLRGGLVAVAQFFFYSSLLHLEFATACTLAFAGPLFITALSVPILKHRVGMRRWSAVVIGFVGIVMIIQPGSDTFTIHALLPVGAAVGYASSYVSVRLMDEEVSIAAINAYAAVGALTGAIILVFATSGYEPVASARDWLWLVVMGGVGGLAVFSLIAAYRSTAPSNIAPFEYFGIPFSFIIGWYVFGETPFARLLPGALLIIVGGLLIFWREREMTYYR